MKGSGIVVCIVLVVWASGALAQHDTTWKKANWLLGTWIGQGSGTTGQGGGWFSMLPDLGGKILVRRNHAEYPATQDKPPIIHDDLMIVYLDETNQSHKAIYFDNEGHTIHYTIDYPGRSLVLTSQRSGSTPNFRLTYTPIDADSLAVTFEMSRDGKEFQMYTEGRCKRKK